MRKHGITTFGFTSEPQSEADKAKANWKIDYDIIGRPENELPAWLSGQGLCKVVVTLPHETRHPRIGNAKAYPHGAAQPALVFVRSQDMVPVFTWAVVPAMMNIGGAKDRPVVSEVWERVKPMLKARAEDLPVSADGMRMRGGLALVWYFLTCGCCGTGKL
eukprot:TRINITY_DN5483_c0_g1_i1.p1 TRINITY_DN5483_c0_g1~~TRINITY_DN5483_c0_g1_i1.p1  ORF type:complete len:161 (+),score=41.97 TRINITY_DN5483_c0_g1_i1:265-747(+)